MLIYRVSLLLIIYFFVTAEFKSQNYIFVNEFAKGISGNTKWFKLVSFTFGPYNRTTKGANFESEINMTITREEDVMVNFNFKIFKNNEYKATPISFRKKLCDILNSTEFDIPNIRRNSSLTPCPVKKGRLYAYDVVPTEKGWPKYLPEGRFLIIVDFVYKNEHIFIIEWMVQIVPVK